ncbi:MAG TPA: response regulator transcription factor [Actinomycetota bacterium]|nr:response regulator transcription factor [Actinomycetota bacterium]
MRILLGEPPGLFRDSIRALLREVGSVDGSSPQIIEASTVEEAARAAHQRPEVAILAASLPPEGGLRAAAAISRVVPGCRIVVLSDGHDRASLIRAVQAGATGFVARVGPLSDLIAAFVAATRGEAYVPAPMLEGILRKAAGHLPSADDPAARIERLTEREREVLAGLALGDGSAALGERLGISPETARTHVQNVLSKLGVHSRLEAVALARRTGLLELWQVGDQPS